MGGGSSKSETKTDQSTRVTTTTTTDIGEIGLVGGDAVELANILATTAALQTDQFSQAAIAQTEQFTQLTRDLAEGVKMSFEKVGDLTKEVSNTNKTPTQLLSENAPILIAGAGVLLFLMRK